MVQNSISLNQEVYANGGCGCNGDELSSIMSCLKELKEDVKKLLEQTESCCGT